MSTSIAPTLPVPTSMPDGRSEAFYAALAAVEAFGEGRLIGFDTEGRVQGGAIGLPCLPMEEESGQC